MWHVRRELHPDAPTLSDLVDDVGRFRARDVFRRPHLSEGSRRDPSDFADPAQLWEDLLGRSARRPTFRLVTSGTTADASKLTRTARIGNRDLADLAAPNRVIDGYRAGATVALQGLHLTDPALAKFANNLALELDQPAQINAYLSPASARGLDVHFDYHDVFVVQLEGTKHWRVWDPTPRTAEPIGGKFAVRRPELDELGDPALDLVLEPGDVLYLPRGHPHLAETTDRSSAHLTVGLLAITWHRVVRQLIDDAVSAGELRSSIPLSTLDPPTLDPQGEDRLPAAVDLSEELPKLSLDLSSLELRRWVAGEIWRRQAATRLRPLEPVDPAAVDRPLRFAAGPLVTLSRHEGRSLLFVGDRTITLPDEAHEFLADVLSTEGTFDRAELRGLDDESSRIVIHRLLDEGVLIAAEDGRDPTPEPGA